MFCKRVFSNSIPSHNPKVMAEEMQQLNEVNESVCNQAQQIGTCDGQQEHRGPVTRSRAKCHVR